MGEYMERGQGAPEQATHNIAPTVPPLAWEPLLARSPPVRPENALPCFNIILTRADPAAGLEGLKLLLLLEIL